MCVSPFFNEDILVDSLIGSLKIPEVPLGLTMIILGASMTPQLQVGLEGWVRMTYISIPSTEFFTKQIYTYITKKSIRFIRPKC